MAIVRAAGAVVWRPGPGGTEIALVHRPRYDDWSFPKGKREPGEHVLRTAVREVAEETGLRVVLGRPLGPSVYQTGAGTKRVSYWAARCIESAGFVPGEEVDQVAWLTATEVRDRLSYQRDFALAEEFASGPAGTVPFILLRHATAGERSAAGSADLARPLDAGGVAEAELLAALLSCYEPCRVISSAAERCLATVRPYAAAAGVPVEVEPAFTVPAGSPAPGALAAAGAGRAAAGCAVDGVGRLLGWRPRYAGPAIGRAAQRAADLAAAGEPALVCGHRENLPVMLEAACRALGARPPAGPPLAKGSFWVLQSAGGVLVSAEQQHLAG
ncbi:MAG TPA: NUDIX hydrolase [Streptosporangiaceae bacterium]|nr:NUDIX hydrolase [Streptosporangiaceae bacterium]